MPANKRRRGALSAPAPAPAPASEPATDQPVRRALLRASRIFQPFRALGCVTNDVPFSLQTRGGMHFVTTCTGNSFQIYECGKLGLLFVGPHTTRPITALASAGDLTVAACGNEVLVFERARLRNVMAGPHRSTVLQLLRVGDLVLSLDEDNTLCTWKLGARDSAAALEGAIEFGARFRVTALCHPATYLNKILVGTSFGTLQLWNIRTSKLVHEFDSVGGAVTCLVPSPAPDVVAVGLLDGTIVLYDILHGERVMAVRQEGAVTAVAFRSDETPVMATANSLGDIALWDMEHRQLSHLMAGAHDGSVSSLVFFPGEPLLMSASSDNSVKQWIFDAADGSGRLLKSRSGHAKPPTCVRFYGTTGSHLLSSGADRALRDLSIVRDAQSVELSQGSLAKKVRVTGLKVEQLKLPVITCFAASEAKEKEWDNIVTCHHQHATVHTWRYLNKTIGRHELKSLDGSFPKACCISTCGNFTVVGYASGRCDMYNLQSGAHRRVFKGHTKAVMGLAVDGLNQRLVSCSLDGTVCVWDFNDARIQHSHNIGCGLTALTLLRDSDLVAVVGDDLAVRVIDIDTAKVVRVFRGHMSRVTDLAFSPDARLLVTCGMDATVRVWDLPTSHLVDVFVVPAIPTSVAFSPSADFLATCHVDHVGVFLWANRLQFSSIPLVPVQSLEPDTGVASGAAVALELPGVNGVDDDSFFVDHPADAPTAPAGTVDEQTSADTLLPVNGLISLSALPKTRWQNLLSLEAIRARNKPIEPPRAPERAPFFLPTVAGVRTAFAPDQETTAERKSAIIKDSVMREAESSTNALLKRCAESDKYDALLEHLLSLGPSATDAAIRSLETLDPAQPLLGHFARFLLRQLDSQRNFEMIQAYLQVFLHVHGELLGATPGLGELLRELRAAEQRSTRRLMDAFHNAACLLDIVRNAPL